MIYTGKDDSVYIDVGEYAGLPRGLSNCIIIHKSGEVLFSKACITTVEFKNHYYTRGIHAKLNEESCRQVINYIFMYV